MQIEDKSLILQNPRVVVELLPSGSLKPGRPILAHKLSNFERDHSQICCLTSFE